MGANCERHGNYIPEGHHCYQCENARLEQEIAALQRQLTSKHWLLWLAAKAARENHERAEAAERKAQYATHKNSCQRAIAREYDCTCGLAEAEEGDD